DRNRIVGRAASRLARKLLLEYGDGLTLGARDHCELEVDHDAVSHVKKKKPWRRWTRAERPEPTVASKAIEETSALLMARLQTVTHDQQEVRYLELIGQGLGKASARKDSGLAKSAADALERRARRKYPDLMSQN